jgi:hypothetical protein
MLLALALIVIWKHGANIERLLAGTEPRIGGRKAETAPPATDTGAHD